VKQKNLTTLHPRKATLLLTQQLPSQAHLLQAHFLHLQATTPNPAQQLKVTHRP